MLQVSQGFQEAMENPVSQPAIFIDARAAIRDLSTGRVSRTDTLFAISTADESLRFSGILYRPQETGRAIIDVTPPDSMNILQRSTAKLKIYDPTDGSFFAAVERAGRTNVEMRFLAGFKHQDNWFGLLQLYSGFVLEMRRVLDSENVFVTDITLQTQIFKGDAQSIFDISDATQKQRHPGSRAFEHVHEPINVSWGSKQASGTAAIAAASPFNASSRLFTTQNLYSYAIGPGTQPSTLRILTENPNNFYSLSFTDLNRKSVTLRLANDRAPGSQLNSVQYQVWRDQPAGRSDLVHQFEIFYNQGQVTPVVQFAQAASTVDEDDGTVNIQVSSSVELASQILIPFRATGSAIVRPAANFDVTLSPAARLTMDPGDSVGRIAVAITDDSTREGPETLILTLQGGTGYQLGARAVHRMTIRASDQPTGVPTIEFSAAITQTEEGQNVLVSVESSTNVRGNVAVFYTLSGTAASNDYTITGSGSLTIANGQRSANIAIAIADDAADEGIETIVLSLSARASYAIGGQSEHTVQIAASDVQAPIAQFAAATSAGNEGATVNIAVGINKTLTQNLTVQYALSGTAASNDYTITGSGSVTILAGETSVNIPVVITNDLVSESSETVILTLGVGTGYQIGTRRAHTLTIRASDRPPAIQVSTAAQTIQEGQAGRTIGIVADFAPDNPLTVNMSAAGTATAGDDYTITGLSGGNFTISLPAGQRTASVSILAATDMLTEQSETVVVEVEAGTGYTVGTRDTQTITIAADNAPDVQWSATTSSAAEGDTVSIEAFVAQPLSYDLEVDYSITGTAASNDYTDSTSGSITINAGSTSAEAEIIITDDTTAETTTETIILTIDESTAYVVGTQDTHTISILPSDRPGVASPTITWAAATATGEEGDTITATINLSAAADGDRVIGYTLGGTAAAADYTIANSGQVSVPYGDTSADIDIAIVNDADREDDETIILTLQSGAGYTLPATTAERVFTATVEKSDQTGLRVLSVESVAGFVAFGMAFIAGSIPTNQNFYVRLFIPASRLPNFDKDRVSDLFGYQFSHLTQTTERNFWMAQDTTWQTSPGEMLMDAQISKGNFSNFETVFQIRWNIASETYVIE